MDLVHPTELCAGLVCTDAESPEDSGHCKYSATRQVLVAGEACPSSYLEQIGSSLELCLDEKRDADGPARPQNPCILSDSSSGASLGRILGARSS